ncbi:hypothetical protein B296_00042767 [Ensete ventricosum]|uniref:Uncharacterized protein n=1 Tax=Ensete ventricosum TaxID=4639 RepID=A0A426ZH88_ENSVE|nr:hypothetical protein B296_00042767 [Ensete ventricosum]
MIPLLPLQEFMSSTSIQGKLRVFASWSSIFYVDSFHADWILHQFLSSVYKPLHEYRVLRVSNSPHQCELCITLSVVVQTISLCTVSFFTKCLACLEHRQVWLPMPCRSSNSATPIFVHYTFFSACLFSWCLSCKGLAILLNASLGCPLL